MSDSNNPGGVSGSHPESEPFPVYASPATQGKGKNTIRMELIPVACWKLEDVRFAFGSSFILPGVKKEFADLADLLKKHPKAPLSVFGHADPVGDDTFNKALSGNRAESIYAVLIRETARWEQLYGGGGAEGWGTASIQEMLNALGYDCGAVDGVSGPKTKAATKKFQGDKSLNPDGVAGPATRERLFGAYMDFLCAFKLSKSDFLGQGADPGGKADMQGCSEFNPLMVFSQAEQAEFSKAENKAKRDQENSINRRVLILLFRPGTTVTVDRWPCPRVDEGVDGCRARLWSDGEKRRSPQAARRKFGDTQNTVACRFYHRMVTLSPCEGVLPKPGAMEWIEVRLIELPELERIAWWVKADYGPYKNENFSAKLTHRTIAGSLDSNGVSKFTQVPAGKCSYHFPMFFDPLDTAFGPAETWPGGGASPSNGSKTEPPKCPKVEIQINLTPARHDELVMRKSDHPAARPKVKCRIHAISGPAGTVVLTNPDGRLRFPEAADSTLSLNVPADGSWVEFEVSGEKESDAMNDAKIEAHCETAGGELVGERTMSVFWFDQAELKINNPGTYGITGDRLTTSGGNAIDYSVKARIRPANVDCTAPQVKDLRIGIMQNAHPGVTRERHWNNPAIVWNPGVAAGTKVSVPSEMRRVTTRPATGQDTDAFAQPLYDRPGLAVTLDPNSIKPPIGCNGGGVATSNDTPSTPGPSSLDLNAVDNNGNIVGTVTYQASAVILSPVFTTWTVVYNVTTKEYFCLRQRGWSVTVDGLQPGSPKAVLDAADADVTVDPVLAPFANDQSNDPANIRLSARTAAQTEFTR